MKFLHQLFKKTAPEVTRGHFRLKIFQGYKNQSLIYFECWQKLFQSDLREQKMFLGPKKVIRGQKLRRRNLKSPMLIFRERR